MNKLMRKAPTIGAVAFLIVQITGLAEYMAHVLGVRDYRADIFSVTLETMIFCAFYWTRQSITRTDGKTDKKDLGVRLSAFAVGIVFMVASGVLNTLKTMTDFTGKMQSLDWYGALLAGISPTIFAALLGMLQGFVDRLPMPPAKHTDDTIPMRVYALVIKQLTLVDARLSAALTPNAGNMHEGQKQCPQCKQWVKNMGSHMRWKHPKKKGK